MSQKFKSEVELQALNAATTDTDKFLVSDGGIIKFRTGAEMLSDLGVAPGVASNIQHQVKAGVAINKGQAVYVSSADGTNMIVSLASNATEATSSKTMGLLTSTVAINGFANVIAEGLLAGLNTSTAAAGDPVWLGTGGNLIYGLANKPYAPAHLVFIGIVTRSNISNGEIFVKIQNGFELDELHDVDVKSLTPVSGHLLGFNGNLWVNKTIAGWLGYTPYNASNPAGYISSYTETDTLASVTGRGASTSTQITLSGGGDNSTTYSSLRFAGYNQGGGVGYHGFFEIQNTYGSVTNGKKFFRLDGSGTIQIINSAYTSNIFNLTDAGDLTVNKIIKSGGTSSQYLMADGSVSTGVSGGVTSFNTRTGAVTLLSSDVTGALGYTPWHSGNDGAGSGLDADTVDGIDSSRIIYGDNASGSSNISNATLDTALKSGFYTVGTGGIPNATAVNFVMHTAYYSPGNTAGFDLACNDSTTSSFYLRPATGGGKGAWQTIVTSSNVSSYAASTSHTHTFDSLTSKTGGTSTYQTSGDFRAPIFYDSNNTGYYVDPASTSNFNVVTMAGGWLNTSGTLKLYYHNGNELNNYTSAGTPGQTLYINYRDTANGGGGGNVILCGTNFEFNTSGVAYASGSYRAPIFYDSNNTGYYIDPASTSNLYTVNATNYLVTPLIYSGGGSVSFGNDIQLSGNYLRFDENGVRSWNQRATGGNLVLNSGDGNGNLVVNGNAIIHSGNIGSQSVSYATTAGSADQIDGIPFRNTGSNASVNADTLESNGITYYTAGVPNFTGNATDGALYSQAYSSAWQHQIAGDYRSGQIAIRGKNSGTWQAWRTVLDSSNVSSYAAPISHTHTFDSLTSKTGGTGNYQTSGQFIASSFADYDNTGFYVNPAGTSNISKAYHSGNIVATNYGYGQVGVYSSVRYQAVFSMGESYILPADGTSIGNLYGMAWSHPNAGGVAGNLNSHGLLVTENGTFLAAISGSIRSRDDMRAPIFYDSNNSGYYIDPSSTSNINVLTTQGNANFFSQLSIENQSTFVRLAFNKLTFWDWQGSQDVVTIDGGYLEAANSLRAPIFYDSNNTSYYTDPASTSVLNGLVLASLSSNDGMIENSSGAYFHLGGWGVGRTAPTAILVNTAYRSDISDYATSAGSAGNADTVDGYHASDLVLYKHQTVDMSNTGVFSASNYYPVTIPIGQVTPITIEIQNNLNSNVPSWATHGAGFSLNLKWTTNGSGWGTTEVKREVSQYHERFANQTICGGITQLTNASVEVVWLRGGGTYYFKFSRDMAATANSGTYTASGQSVSPTASAQNTVWNSNSGYENYYANNIFVSENIYSPVYYDNNNTAFYIDPASSTTSAVFFSKIQFNIGGSSASTLIQATSSYGTNSINTYYNVMHTSGDFYIGNPAGGAANLYGANANFNIFYDRNNTAYYFDGSSTGDSIRVAGDIVAYYSDDRLKDRKGNIENALEKVLSLNGFYYEANQKAQELGYKKKMEVGVSAQEVEAILPELIKDAPIGQGYKTLDYGRLTPLLIEAIKDQQKQIEELKELVNKLITK